MGLTGEEVLATANSYTDETVVGGGAIKGKNCTIDSIVDITGGHRVTYKWTLDDGTVQTDTMDVMDGEQGPQGVGVPEGGAVGQVLGKKSGTDFDTEWVDRPVITVDSALSTESENSVQNKVLTNALGEKVDKVSGKGLSANDYTNADKAIVDGVTSALSDKVDKSVVGVANGVAELGEDGKVVSSQLPAAVDTIVEGYYKVADGKFYDESTYETEITPQSNIIYVSLDTNKTYRWSSTQYVEISASLALGETAQTAYAGNKGKANADAIEAIKDGQNLDSFADVESALENKISKSNTAGLVKNDGSIDTTQYLSQHQDITGKADKVANATNGNFAGLDGNGNLVDSGNSASDFLTQHQDISGKADKVGSATNGNFAGLNANGNLTDSGKKASDFVAKTTYTSHVANNGSKNFLAMRLGVLKSKNYSSVKWDGNTYISAGMTLVCNVIPGTDIVESFTLSGTTTSTTPFSFTPYCGNMNFNGKAVTIAMIADKTNSNIRVTASGSNYLYANTTQQRYNYTPTSNVWGSQIYVGRSVTISDPVTFKLMICLKSDYDFDSTWVAPAKTNLQLGQDITDLNNALAVNYVPRKEAGEYTNQGITYTVNDDGTVTLTDGTVTTTPSGYTLGKVKGLVHGKKYRLSGLPSPVGNCFIKMYNQSWSNTMEISAGNLEQVFTYDEATAINDIQVGIRVVGTAANNQVFKPMITPVDYDGPYVPCTLSNEDLTSFMGEWQIVDPLMAFTVTGDGEKTYGEILSELYTQINDAIHALKKGERLAVNRLRNASSTDIPCTNPYSYFINTENLSPMTFSGSYFYNATNNEIGVWLIYIHSTASSCRMIWYKVGASGIMTYNVHVDDVFPSGSTLSVRATKYRGPKI